MQKIEKIHGKSLSYKNQTNDLKTQDDDLIDHLISDREDIGKLILRLTIGSLMLIHGIHKLVFGTEMVSKILADVGTSCVFWDGSFFR